jgi:hypothetical protein
VEFIRALRVHLSEMTSRLARIERQDVTRRNARACAMRIEAAALRRDINEAQILIDRLQRGYLNANKHNEQCREVKCQPWRTDLCSVNARPPDDRLRIAAHRSCALLDERIAHCGRAGEDAAVGTSRPAVVA